MDGALYLSLRVFSLVKEARNELGNSSNTEIGQIIAVKKIRKAARESVKRSISKSIETSIKLGDMRGLSGSLQARMVRPFPLGAAMQGLSPETLRCTSENERKRCQWALNAGRGPPRQPSVRQGCLTNLSAPKFYQLSITTSAINLLAVQKEESNLYIKITRQSSSSEIENLADDIAIPVTHTASNICLKAERTNKFGRRPLSGSFPTN